VDVQCWIEIPGRINETAVQNNKATYNIKQAEYVIKNGSSRGTE
jgi:hypothetical protein